MASSGWTPQKRQAFERGFYQYLDRCYVNSKDAGLICLGKSLYYGQKYAFNRIFNALERDIHDIYCLKSRQLGMSTGFRALSAFYIGIHPGLKGAIVFDTAENKNEARSESEQMINDLPSSLKFPAIKSNNRQGLTLVNDSKILFMSAGVKKTKTSGTLGRSVGLSFSHSSEMCSWDNDEGLESFKNSLSDVNPNRLYLWESTARGYNQWHTMWTDARHDPEHCECIFLGWWAKDSQKIERDHRDFKLYGEDPPSKEEAEKIEAVKRLYDVDISPEQLAWVRRKMNPASRAEGDASPAFDNDDPLRTQEQPWTEHEAFQKTGATFFAPQVLTEQNNTHVSNKFSAHMFLTTDTFSQTKIYKATNARNIELKVWEEPDPYCGEYVIGIDPAYGANEYNNNSSIQVLRCYADGVDQVAEYASPLITTQHLAWVIGALLGWYGQGQAKVRYILELNGPGSAVFEGFKQLKFQMENGPQPTDVREKGLDNVFRNVRTYIYSRVDSLGSGFNYHLKTSQQLKVALLERLRDVVSTGILRVRSQAAIDEMDTIARDGDQIGAPGSMRDDRVLALAFAVRCWEEKVRKDMIIAKRSREAEAARQRMSVVDQVYLYNKNTLGDFFRAKQMGRFQQRQIAARQSWRHR